METDSHWQSWNTSSVHGDRISFWSDVVVHGVINSEMERLTAGRFDGELWSRTSPTGRFVNFRTREHAISRTPSQTRGGDGHIMIGLQCHGVSLFEQNDTRIKLLPGQIAIIDSNRPFHLLFPDRVERRLVLLPRTDFAPLLNHGDFFSAPLRLTGQSGDEQLARGVINRLTDTACNLSDESCADMIDVLVSALTRCLRPEANVGRRNIRQLSRIKMCMHDQLSDPETDPRQIASLSGVSIRTLHRLFASERQTFSRTLLNMRLDCARMLIEEKCGSTLTDIAFACGFVDLAHFSRTYRAKFGESPSSARGRLR